MNSRRIAVLSLLALAMPMLQLAGCQPPSRVAAPITALEPAAGAYLDPAAVDERALMVEPPATPSPQQLGDVELILAIRAAASPESVARAKSEADMTPAIFADVLGPTFTPRDKPATFAWLARAAQEAKAIGDRAKDRFARPRPYDADERLAAGREKGGKVSFAYPSGHATRAMAWATLLAEVYPEHRSALMERAALVGYDRIVLGLHYASDVAAGNALGVAIGREMLKSPACRADMEKARGEAK